MVKVKVCGITNLDDALAAVEFGTDMLGFIFANSPRRIEEKTAKDIIANLPRSVLKVGVFMDHPIDEVNEISEFCRFDMAQLHGRESPEFCAAITVKVIKSFSPETLPNPDRLTGYPVEAFMLDRQKGAEIRPEELWPIAREIASNHRLILAGGLTPENVAEAIRAVEPYAVDVASGVEKAPGIKDHHKMKDFISSARW